MDLNSLRSNYKDQILFIASECMVDDIRVFGSITRGKISEDSDIDFVVRMKPNSGFAIGGLKWKIEELLRRKVDIVSEGGINHSIKDQVLKEAVYL
jgi:predicted nucleotidyltransferase